MKTPALDGEISPISEQCSFCKHYIEGLRCRAFDIDIPLDIWTGKIKHNQPIDDDNGILYEPTDAIASSFTDI